jgi:hypothetical protein
MSWYLNPETGEEKFFTSPPGDPWSKGRSKKGKNAGWIEKRSRISCRFWGCDCVYVLKVTTKDGLIFGKWGSSKESTFRYREKEFRRKKFTFEVIRWGFFGELTEDVEAAIGRKLSKHPVEVPRFYGFTETFEWSETTQQLLKEVWNGLEESAPSVWEF